MEGHFVPILVAVSLASLAATLTITGTKSAATKLALARAGVNLTARAMGLDGGVPLRFHSTP